MPKKSEINFENFIDSKIKIKTGDKISPAARIMDFSSIEISLIDPNLRQEIEKNLLSVKQKLCELKSLTNN